MKQFLVYGAGALGSVVAARLATAHDVALVGRRDHVEAIRARGLTVTGKTQLETRSLEALEAVDEGPYDAVIVTTKAYDTERAVSELSRFWDTAIFVSLQNGLGNEETMAARTQRVVGAVINQGATFLGPGEVFHAGEGETTLGPFSGTTLSDAREIASGFNEVGLRAVATQDIRAPIWAKVVLNAAVNPVTALLGRRTGELLDDEPLESVMAAVVHESSAIAAACGIELDAGSIMDKIQAVARATRDNKSSMLQDLERGRKTEIEAITGALVERARKHGVPAPVNELLLNLIRSAERNPSPCSDVVQ